MITCLARHFILMTSAGARGSGIYLQTKGKIEQAVIGFGFEQVDLICPGFLIGSFKDRSALRPAMTGAPQPSSPPLHSLPLSLFLASPDAGQVFKNCICATLRSSQNRSSERFQEKPFLQRSIKNMLIESSEDRWHDLVW